eukprot:TRINITY_DN6449_c0_g1_i1.p1 TRINITY_DN6449_c0_g1~~TRINITY_DN6449_c0_g1_i1.p1  ORF type:complete len:266 (+),score=55.63 TRINITY_DN6449_c0_g1_i1:1596-2393(+)
MKLLILLLGLTSLICSSLAVNNPSGCAYSFTVTQTARPDTWTQDGKVFTTYDITITNTGSTSFHPYFFIGIYADSAFDITTAWNLIEYGYTNPAHHTISVDPSQDITVDPGATWTGTGYIVGGVTTDIVLFPDSCPASPSDSSDSSSSDSSSESSNSTCASVTFNLRTTWTTDSTPYYLYDLTISNSGSKPLTVVSFTLIASADFQISQDWNLIDFGFTDPKQHPVGLRQDENISVPPGGSYTGAGLVVSGSTLDSIDVWQSNCD